MAIDRAAARWLTANRAEVLASGPVVSGAWDGSAVDSALRGLLEVVALLPSPEGRGGTVICEGTSNSEQGGFAIDRDVLSALARADVGLRIRVDFDRDTDRTSGQQL